MQKEYKTRHDCEGKLILWELCNKLKFSHTAKWNIHKLEFILVNKTYKLLWEFDIQTDYLIPAIRPDLMIVKKKKKKVKKEKEREFAE